MRRVVILTEISVAPSHFLDLRWKQNTRILSPYILLVQWVAHNKFYLPFNKQPMIHIPTRIQMVE